MVLLALVVALQKPSLSDLDFWVGDWDCILYSRNPESKSGWDQAPAHEHVTKDFDGHVVKEEFSMDGYRGMSVNALDPKRGTWRQTYVDQTGLFATFEGGLRDGNFVFDSLPEQGSVPTRMIFDRIEKDLLEWHVERQSKKTAQWTTTIKMSYKRRQ